MRTYIFTECGSKIGFGHLYRCIAIYDEAVARNCDVQLVIHSDLNVTHIVGNRNCCQMNWMTNDYLSGLDASGLCIIDSYIATREVYKSISEKLRLCVYIDDINRLDYPKGIVVKPSLRHSIKKINNNNVKLEGRKYIIVRDAFINNKRKVITETVRNIMIMIGGTDPLDLTWQIFESLNAIFSEVNISIVLTKSSRSYERIQKFISETNSHRIKLFTNLNPNEMQQLMVGTDIGIIGAGQSIYEMMATGTPFLPIKVANNQNDNVKLLIENKYISNYIEPNKHFVDEVLREVKMLLDYELRSKMSQCYHNVIDFDGPRRIVDLLYSDR